MWKGLVGGLLSCAVFIGLVVGDGYDLFRFFFLSFGAQALTRIKNHFASLRYHTEQ